MLAAGDGSVLSWAKLFACVHNLDGQDGAPTPFATHADAPPPREPAESGAWGFVRRKLLETSLARWGDGATVVGLRGFALDDGEALVIPRRPRSGS